MFIPKRQAVFPFVSFLVLGATLVPGLAGCSKQDRPEAASAPQVATGGAAEMTGAPRAASVASADAPTEAKVPAILPRKIIYNGTIELGTEDWVASVKHLSDQVKAFGGFIAETSVSGTPGQSRTGTWKVRVPVEKFDAFMAGLGTLGETRTSGVTSEDVSEEFYDLEARLKNKRVEEARLIQHLQQSTGKLTEILAVEREISRVREEIERMEGRKRFLANRADLATVTITLQEIRAFSPQTTPTLGTQIARTFGDSLSALSGFTQGLVLTLVALLPWLVVAAGIGYPLWRLRRRRSAKPVARPFHTNDKPL